MRLAIAVVVIACLLIAGCGGGNKLVGKWQGPSGMTFEFAADGKMTAGMMGMSSNGTYKVEGNKLTMSGLFPGMPDLPQTFAISGDTLTLGEGAKPMTLTRVKQ